MQSKAKYNTIELTMEKMNKIFARINLRLYLLFLVWGLIFLISLIFPTTPLTFLIGFLFLLFLPGFLLSRILKIKIRNDLFGMWMIYLVTGFIFNLLFCLLAILTHANITILLIAYGISLPVLFILAFILDLKRPVTDLVLYSYKDIFKLENLIYLVPVTLIILIIFALNKIGADFAGDPTYHLSIVSKVVDGGPFGVGSLAFPKNQPQVQYAYLIWPVFLGLLSKIFHLNIFTLWDEIIVGLTVVAALSWAWVFKQIFNQKFLVILALVIFLIFNLTNSAWLLTRFPVPDTINKLFLLPLSLALAFQFIFDSKRDWKILGLTVTLLLISAFIHLTQYIYFFFMLGAFALVYAVSFWRTPNYKEVLRRILILALTAIILYIPFVLAVQLKYGAVGEILAWFTTVQLVLIYGHFKDYDVPVQYAFVILPLVALFCRRNPKILFLLVIMLIAPVIYYFGPLREFISLKLSFVFVRRMFSNMVWFFGVWALIAGFVIILIDRLTISAKSRQAKLIINSIVAMVTILLLSLDFKFHWLTYAYQFILGSKARHFLEANFVWLIILVLILSLAALIGQKYSQKFQEFFELKEPQNLLITFFLTAVLTFWLATDARPFLAEKWQAEAKSSSFFRAIPDATAKTAQVEDIGGDDVLNFIKTQLPKRPIFAASSGYLDLSQLGDVYMAAWGDYLPDKELSNLYRTDTPINEKFACLSYYKVEYLLLAGEPSKVEQWGFGRAPQYLTQVYSTLTSPNQQITEIVQIYQINTSKIQSDFQFEKNAPPPLCRAKKYQE